MRTSVVILPDQPWPELRAKWREAEERGFTQAWTYDHLSWRTLRDGPWLGTVPLLAALAEATSRIRLGPLVTSPNFRHPALLAKDTMTLDQISGGRIDLGIGSGGTGHDARILGEPLLDPAERAARMGEFIDALDILLREPATSYQGRTYTVIDSRTLPGCIQRPRVPFAIAAAGPKAMRVAAQHGATWVTYGPHDTQGKQEEWFASLSGQVSRLDSACLAAGRNPRSIKRMFLVGLTLDWAQNSWGAWEEFVGRLAGNGFTDVAVHWPRPEDPELKGPHPEVFERISAAI